MAKRRRDVSVGADEQVETDARDAILVAPQVTLRDMTTGDSESVWVWELED